MYPAPWNPARVRQVLTTESRQKARDLFLRTHRPFRHIRLDFCKEADFAGHFVDEEQVYALITAGALDADNRLFLVVGEAGAGKSELCQWLEYRTDPAQRLALHIPRSMTSAAHVTTLLRRALGLAGAPLLRRTPVATQARHVALSAAVLLYEQGDPTLAPAAVWEALLDSSGTRAAIAAHLTAAAHGETSHQLLPTPASIGPQTSVSAEVLAASWPALRRLVALAMEQTLWLGDLRDTLTQIARAAVTAGVRPLLLLEDVTAFRVLGDRLLDYLLDLTSGHFDAVIGATTGFERTQLAGATLLGDLTHLHQRLRARLVLTDDLGRAYGLDDEVVALTRGYLGAIRNASPDPALATYDEAFGPGLYPFTETVLRRACAALHEEGNPRQTPRLFLEYVLGAALLSPDLPPTVLDRSPYLNPPPALFLATDAPDPSLRALLRWYGHIGADAITLDERIAALWGVPIPPDLLHNGQIRVARTYVPPPSSSTTPAPAAWHRELRELQQWLDQGGLYPSRETLKAGIERAILALGDPRALGSPTALSTSRAELAYARGDERIPIALGRASGDQPVTRASPKLFVHGLPEEQAILEELAYLALTRTEIGPLCRNLALTLAWAQAHFATYQAAMRQLFFDQIGLSPEHFILIAWRMLAGLRGEPLDDPPNLHPSAKSVVSPWSDGAQRVCAAAGSALLARCELFRRLYIGTFTLRDTLLDRTRLDAALADFKPEVALVRLADLPLAALKTTPFRVRPSGERLYDLLAVLQPYAVALLRLDLAAALHRDTTELTACAAHLAAQVQVQHGELRRQLSLLHWRCGEVGVVWREPWDAALTFLTDSDETALTILQDLVTTALAAAEATNNDLWAYQTLRHSVQTVLAHPYWAANEALRAIQVVLLRTARTRYRDSGKLLTATPDYRALLKTVRQLRTKLRDG